MKKKWNKSGRAVWSKRSWCLEQIRHLSVTIQSTTSPFFHYVCIVSLSHQLPNTAILTPSVPAAQAARWINMGRGKSRRLRPVSAVRRFCLLIDIAMSWISSVLHVLCSKGPRPQLARKSQWENKYQEPIVSNDELYSWTKYKRRQRLLYSLSGFIRVFLLCLCDIWFYLQRVKGLFLLGWNVVSCLSLSLSPPISRCVVCFSMLIPDIMCCTLSCDGGRWDTRPCAAGVRGEYRRTAGRISLRPLIEELLLTDPWSPLACHLGRQGDPSMSHLRGRTLFDDVARRALEKDNRMREWSAAQNKLAPNKAMATLTFSYSNPRLARSVFVCGLGLFLHTHTPSVPHTHGHILVISKWRS